MIAAGHSGASMIILNIIWPVLAMVALIFVVWFTLVVQRVRHIRRTPPAADTFASRDIAGRYFAPVAMPADNLANLFEMPVLFFALVPLLVIAGQASAAQVVLAWLFVLLRAVHSFIHIGPKRVPARFFAYLASCAVLAAMWLGFGIDMVSAASRYHAALAMIAAQP
jgi:hypothetical protein